MKIISRIIFFSWWKFFLSSFIVLMLLVTTGDFINGFLRGFDLSRVFLDYSLKLPTLMGFIIPLCCLLASLFSINAIKSTNELVAILASSYSPYKFYMLIFIFLIPVFLSHIGLSFYAQPYAAKKERENASEFDRKKFAVVISASIGDGTIWYKAKNYFAKYNAFDPTSQKIYKMDLYFFDPEQFISKKILKSESGQFLVNKWQLQNIASFSDLNKKSFVAEKKFKSAHYGLKITPTDLKGLESDLTTLDYFKLKKFISSLSKSGINISPYLLTLYEKISVPLSCLVFGMFPVVDIHQANRRNQSLGKSMLFVFLFSIGYALTTSSLRALGSSGVLGPELASFLPSAIFSIALFLLILKRRNV